ncbi:MAG: 3'(2'),5'-bisphosphate nucleotidase CysQ, partial [Mesorhizobium sp.]
SHNTPETDAFIRDLGAAEIVSVGSSLKFCLVAAAEADVYPRFGRTMEWDTAAGDAVLRAAGGMTRTLDGKPLAYGKRDQATDADFANPHFIASGKSAGAA